MSVSLHAVQFGESFTGGGNCPVFTSRQIELGERGSRPRTDEDELSCLIRR